MPSIAAVRLGDPEYPEYPEYPECDLVEDCGPQPDQRPRRKRGATDNGAGQPAFQAMAHAKKERSMETKYPACFFESIEEHSWTVMARCLRRYLPHLADYDGALIRNQALLHV